MSDIHPTPPSSWTVVCSCGQDLDVDDADDHDCDGVLLDPSEQWACGGYTDGLMRVVYAPDCVSDDCVGPHAHLTTARKLPEGDAS